MIKIVMDITDIEYDDFVDTLLKNAREHPEQLGGAKIPPFAGKMFRHMPKAQKNEMISDTINKHKDIAIPQIERVLSQIMGPVRLTDMHIGYDRRAAVPITFMLEASYIDSPYIISNIMPSYYKEQDGPAILGASYGGPYDLYSVQNYMRGLDTHSQQILAAKGMSANKAVLMDRITGGFSSIGITMRMNAMHIFVK